MARKRSSRPNPKFQVLRVNQNLALSTLATQTVLLLALTGLGSTKFKVVSADLAWSLSDHTAAEGPIEVGLCNGDLTTGECAEALDAVPTSMSDVIAMERLRRPIRRAGMFAGLAADEVLNDGKPIRTKFRTFLDVGIELNAWVRNLDDSSLTSGSLVTVVGNVYGYWA